MSFCITNNEKMKIAWAYVKNKENTFYKEINFFMHVSCCSYYNYYLLSDF